MFADDGTRAMKKVLVQNNRLLQFVKEDIRISSGSFCLEILSFCCISRGELRCT